MILEGRKEGWERGRIGEREGVRKEGRKGEREEGRKEGWESGRKDGRVGGRKEGWEREGGKERK